MHHMQLAASGFYVGTTQSHVHVQTHALSAHVVHNAYTTRARTAPIAPIGRSFRYVTLLSLVEIKKFDPPWVIWLNKNLEIIGFSVWALGRRHAGESGRASVMGGRGQLGVGVCEGCMYVCSRVKSADE